MTSQHNEQPSVAPEPFQKSQASYFNYEKSKFRHSIVKLEIDGYIYYLTFAAKKQSLLSDQCQFYAYCDREGHYFLGYAYQSDGFPYNRARHPCSKEKISFDLIKNISIEHGHSIVVEWTNKEKAWKIKFQTKELTNQWTGLLFDLIEKHKNGDRMPSSTILSKSLIHEDNVVSGVSTHDKNSSVLELDRLRKDVEIWRERAEQLEKENKELLSIMNKKEEKLEDIQEKHERMDRVAPIYEQKADNIINTYIQNIALRDKAVHKLTVENAQLRKKLLQKEMNVNAKDQNLTDSKIEQKYPS